MLLGALLNACQHDILLFPDNEPDNNSSAWTPIRKVSKGAIIGNRYNQVPHLTHVFYGEPHGRIADRLNVVTSENIVNNNDNNNNNGKCLPSVPQIFDFLIFK